jgi:hypothetical protein
MGHTYSQSGAKDLGSEPVESVAIIFELTDTPPDHVDMHIVLASPLSQPLRQEFPARHLTNTFDQNLRPPSKSFTKWLT